MEFEVKKRVLEMVEQLKEQFAKENNDAKLQNEEERMPVLREREEQDRKTEMKRMQKLEAKNEMRKQQDELKRLRR